ncbi:hypothetical protein DFJ73DRAFT_821284 [Zopfochytrium polystomum]|nr:hypothetical protein DFJ73DRAFT_821284 [Zopfochytrium polystomum]
MGMVVVTLLPAPSASADPPSFLHGHLGATPASVTGLCVVSAKPVHGVNLGGGLRTQQPQPSTVGEDAVVEIRLLGVARTGWFDLSNRRSSSALRQVHSVASEQRSLFDKKITIRASASSHFNLVASVNANNEHNAGTPSFGLFARRSGTAARAVVAAGMHSVPFRFSLPSILPPSFVSLHGSITYTLSATIKYSHSKSGKMMKKTTAELIIVRRYNLEHIVPPSPTLTVPTDDEISTVPFPALPLNRTATIDFQSWDSCTEPVVVMHRDDPDLPEFEVNVPVRSFGPDDPIIAHVHISKLPQGQYVHHVELTVSAEISVRANNIVKKTRHLILRHRDFPLHAGFFWKRRIDIAPRRQPEVEGGSEQINAPTSRAESPSVRPMSAMERLPPSQPSIVLQAPQSPKSTEELADSLASQSSNIQSTIGISGGAVMTSGHPGGESVAADEETRAASSAAPAASAVPAVQFRTSSIRSENDRPGRSGLHSPTSRLQRLSTASSQSRSPSPARASSPWLVPSEISPSELAASARPSRRRSTVGSALGSTLGSRGPSSSPSRAAAVSRASQVGRTLDLATVGAVSGEPSQSVVTLDEAPSPETIAQRNQNQQTHESYGGPVTGSANTDFNANPERQRSSSSRVQGLSRLFTRRFALRSMLPNVVNHTHFETPSEEIAETAEDEEDAEESAASSAALHRLRHLSALSAVSQPVYSFFFPTNHVEVVTFRPLFPGLVALGRAARSSSARLDSEGVQQEEETEGQVIHPHTPPERSGSEGDTACPSASAPLPPSQERAVNSNPPSLFKGLAFAGARAKCRVEVPIVLHAASVRETRFLRGYIHGPDDDTGRTAESTGHFSDSSPGILASSPRGSIRRTLLRSLAAAAEPPPPY